MWGRARHPGSILPQVYDLPPKTLGAHTGPRSPQKNTEGTPAPSWGHDTCSRDRAHTAHMCPQPCQLHQVHSPATPASFHHLPCLAHSRRTRRRASHTSARAVRGDAGGADVPRGATSSFPAAPPQRGSSATRLLLEAPAQTEGPAACAQSPEPSPASVGGPARLSGQ